MSKFSDQFAGRLDGQTVLVTGAKGGIGYESAQSAGNSGATVLVHARGADIAQQAVERLASTGNGKGKYIALTGDLGSLAGVRQLVDAVHHVSPRGLNGLVNNAGAAFSSRALSPDGYERTIAINHVALAALTSGLLDVLRKGADDLGTPSRVVNMTAVIEKQGNLITDWSYPGKFNQIQAYGDAKLLALMYTYALARRHEGEGLTFNAVSPGAVKTTLGSKAGGPFKIIQALTNPFIGPPEKGSRGVVRLLADPELATATGGYYSSAQLKKSSEKSRDRVAQDRVYDQTEREVHVDR
ncbi:SDR family NAD(P)-dependent oxidoreductase [Leifsonia aquatica]|uniref:SDR family NAD(P)-dependent oxidoreductase n=1 Tax=Leifsonia aquatica TaxID=144185 RepID=UPI0028A5C4F9|nr:SDR family NAD(P)-dependent oxidoreductase [Leifsonia aquatica]